MGTHVVTGTATAVVVLTGKETAFGKISETLKLRPPETEFERGTRQFGYLLMEVTFLLLITVFAINVFFSRPVLESLIFALFAREPLSFRLQLFSLRHKSSPYVRKEQAKEILAHL